MGRARRVIRAARDVRRARRRMNSITQCASTMPGHEERRCDLLDGHDGDHRHRPAGELQAHTWA